jgi:hypothetical protein
MVHWTARSVLTVPLILYIVPQFAEGGQYFLVLEPAKVMSARGWWVRTSLEKRLVLLCPCDLHAEFFGQPFANLRRQAIMHAARAFLGRIQHGDRRGRGYRDHKPDQRGECETCQGCNLQPEGVPWTKMADHAKGQQEYATGNRSQRNQAYVDDAVHALPAAAVLTSGEVAFVVAAHLWRQAGDIIAPARQDLAHDRIDALLTHLNVVVPNKRSARLETQATALSDARFLVKTAEYPALQPDRRQNLGLHRHQHPALKQPTPLGQCFLRFLPGDFRVIILFG